MCYFMQQTKEAKELEHRFKANFKEKGDYIPGIYNGFQFPKTPVITNHNMTEIELYQWGLIPHWAKDESIQKFTLNARLETLSEKPSFKHIRDQRCVIISDAFFEWQWLDPKGKKKQKYKLSLPQNELFCFAGLYSLWQDPILQEQRKTYTILTTSANLLMSEIHNSKQRMPIVLTEQAELQWLKTGKLELLNDHLYQLYL